MMDLEEQLNFTNKLKHPTQPSVIVYRFFEASQAEYFTELLVEEDIDFEAQIDDDHPKKPTYFGIARSRETHVDRLNYIALGKGRDKFIPTATMRWIIISLSALTIMLAVLGYLLA